MLTLLPNLFDNPAEGIHEIKCKNEYDDKNLKHMELTTKMRVLLWVHER